MRHITCKKLFSILGCAFAVCVALLVPTLAIAADESNPQDGDHANSFRYFDGELIEAVEDSGSNQDEGPEPGLVAAANPYSWFYINSSKQRVNCTSAGIAGIRAKGIDVSNHQGTISWNTVAGTDVNFVIIRCGYGNDLTKQDDTQWLANVSACERLGIPYGVYLYSYATNTSMAQSEANHALRLLKGHYPQLPVYLDLEDNSITKKCGNSQIAANARVFCNAISQAGYTPGIYSNLYWRNRYLTDPVFNTWHYWIAQYSSRCSYGGSYDIWQSGQCNVRGIANAVDNNFLFTDLLRGSNRPAYGGSFVTDLPAGEYKICLRANPDYVLDNSNSTANKANVHLWANAGYDAAQQLWTFQLQSDGTYKICNVLSGKVLDVWGGETKNGANVQQWASNDAREERWYAERLADGSFAFQNAKSGTYLDIEGARIANGTNAQLWSPGTASAQTFVLRSRSDYLSHDEPGSQGGNETIQPAEPGPQPTESDSQTEKADPQPSPVSSEAATTPRQPPISEVENVPLYRLYNQWSGEHLFTADEGEYDSLAGIGWNQEGVAWSSPLSGGAPVYRLYNPYSGDHFYTRDAGERGRLVDVGWNYEGVTFRSLDSGMPIYRLYNPWLTQGTHLFTTDAQEYVRLCSLGWRGEEIAFYGLS